MIYQLSLKVNYNRVAKINVEAKNRDDLKQKVDNKMPFWSKNFNRLTVKELNHV